MLHDCTYVKRPETESRRAAVGGWVRGRSDCCQLGAPFRVTKVFCRHTMVKIAQRCDYACEPPSRTRHVVT